MLSPIFLCFIFHLFTISNGKHTIILLAGQSNMSGRGGIQQNNTWDGVVPPQSRPNPSIQRLTAGLKWVNARDPLHKDIDVNATCGVGPGMSFANRLLRIQPRLGPIGLVPCAIGGPRGTKINEWRKGGLLYNRLITRATAAMSGGGSIMAVLWFQGESDTVNPVDAKMYKRRLVNLFNSVRADLGSPLLPIVHVAIASGQGAFVETVRKAQLETKLRKVSCVDAKGLPLLADNLHLSTSAQVRLGGMLADALFNLTRRN